MRIALIHYHLNTGGVTSVIRQQIEALKSFGWEAVVISGAEADDSFPAPVITLPGLGYDNPLNLRQSPEAIAENILHRLYAHWPQGADLIHVHNPTLAKNRHLQGVLKIVQQSGPPLLCQIHDFAEDGRPEAYYQEDYVQDCHFAAINQRDHRLLIQSGLHADCCHLLPNAISPLSATKSVPLKSAWVLYPVRAIRRKNIGEAIMLSFFFSENEQLAITLPPKSPKDVESYNQWRQFVNRHGLRVRFEVGVGADFQTLMAACKYVLTTSITEGFGFAFLEPWTARKALWGRLLSSSCQGFTEHGVDLSHLYTRLRVPLNWVDEHVLGNYWKSAFMRAANDLNLDQTATDADAAWRSVSHGGNIDFGLLDESYQQQIILKVLTEPAAGDRLKALNAYLHHPGPPEAFETVIEHNRRAIRDLYQLPKYAQQLKEVYLATIKRPARHTIDKTVLASAFMNPREFSLLKWGPLH